MHILENEKKIKNLWASCFTLYVTTRITRNPQNQRNIEREL